MRRNGIHFCSKIDLDGKPSRYYPKFRPRRLVMPIDTTDIFSDSRQKNLLRVKYQKQNALRRHVERRGALKLAVVPAERSVGDACRLMLNVCEQENLFSLSFAAKEAFENLRAEVDRVKRDLSNCSEKLCEDQPVLESTKGVESKGISSSSTENYFSNVSLNDNRSSSLSTQESEKTNAALSVREVDEIWKLLNSVPLNSPVLGAFAMRGKAKVEMTIASLAYKVYPRLRSKHLQSLLHECCGLLPCARIAERLGFGEYANVSAEIRIWRELNILQNRLETARRQASAHLERVERGVAQQRRWYWRGVLRSAASRLRLFPVEPSDIQPRLEWIRSSLFVFVFFLDLIESSGDASVNTEKFIKRMFCAQLASFAERSEVLKNANNILENVSSTPESRKTVKVLLERFLKEEEFVGREHPLNARTDRRKDQFESSAGAHGTQALKDDLFDDHQAVVHSHQAPPLVLSALATNNTIKEAQIILKYSPDTAAALRNLPIDVDQVIRRTTEVVETNNYASLSDDQQFRQVEYTVCRLYVGKYCIGEGKGEHLIEAMNQAGQDMLFNYYLRQGKAIDEVNPKGKTSASSLKETGRNQQRNSKVNTEEAREFPDGGVNIHPTTLEEELLL